jgi:hypothetical protein
VTHAPTGKYILSALAGTVVMSMAYSGKRLRFEGKQGKGDNDSLLSDVAIGRRNNGGT